MERAARVRVLPISYAWNDVGSWSALQEVIAADDEGNVRAGAGTLVAEDARDNVVYGPEGHITALIGVDGLVVVHSNGATLVMPKARAQEVRRVVERLERERPEQL